MIVRRRWLIFWGVVVCALAGFVHAKQQVEVFRAEATVLPAEERDFLRLEGGGQQPDRRSFYLDILKSIPLNRRMVEKEYTYTLEGEAYTTNLLKYFQAKTLQQGINALLGAAEFTSQGGILTIAVETRSPELSEAVANEYVAQLMEYNQEKLKDRIKDQLRFIEERKTEVQDSLAAVEERLIDFRMRNRFLESEAGTGYLTPEQSIAYSRLQREVQIRSSLLSTVLNQYEIAQVEAKKEIPGIEVLNYAERPEFGEKLGAKKAVTLSSAVGLFVSVFLAFLLEYFERNRQSGRLDPIVKELKKDGDRVRRLFQRGRG